MLIYRVCITETCHRTILDSPRRNYFFPKTEGLVSMEKKKKTKPKLYGYKMNYTTETWLIFQMFQAQVLWEPWKLQINATILYFALHMHT